MQPVNDPTTQAPQVPFDDFIVYVTAGIAGVPAEAAGFAVRLAAIEWARRTRAIKRTIHLPILTREQAYAIQLTDAWSLLGISEVSVDGCRLTPAVVGSIRNGGRRYAFEQPDALYLTYPPARDGLAEIRIAVVPGQDSCFIDRWVYDLHAEDIAKGAEARLLNMSTEPWYNPSAAQMAQREFNRLVARSTTEARGGYSSESQMMQTPRGSFL